MRRKRRCYVSTLSLLCLPPTTPDGSSRLIRHSAWTPIAAASIHDRRTARRSMSRSKSTDVDPRRRVCPILAEKNLAKCGPEVRIENRIDDRIEKAIEISEPDDNADENIWIVTSVSTEWTQQRQYEERQPADDKRTGYNSESSRCFSFSSLFTLLLCPAFVWQSLWWRHFRRWRCCFCCRRRRRAEGGRGRRHRSINFSYRRVHQEWRHWKRLHWTRKIRSGWRLRFGHGRYLDVRIRRKLTVRDRWRL